MAVKKLLEWNDPLLRKKTRWLTDDEIKNGKVEEWGVDLRDSLVCYGGYGLAGPQIGINAAIFVADMGNEIKTFYNCVLIPLGNDDEKTTMEEGCLSFPGLTCKVPRFVRVKLGYWDSNNDARNDIFTGLTARIIQHEYDHTQGILFYKRANRYHRDQFERKLKSWARMKKANC